MASTQRQKKILISEPSATDRVYIDVATLAKTRALIQARSGGGKSHLMRLMMEQAHGTIQQIVIDVEGEFQTLREQFDFVLAGKEGDTPANPHTAKLLAERLLELHTSAVIDLYELKRADRIEFVGLFLDAMVNSPKHLWHPVLVYIDEAHLFCPQQDRSECSSATAVIDLLSRGRKRGFCAILATQRLSKLHKDAAAECQNKLFGATSLDIDIKRVADELGMNLKSQRAAMRDLTPGEFYGFGPAISRAVIKFKADDTQTHAPKQTGRKQYHAPPPTKKIRALLPSLADIPAETEQRELTAKELRRKVKESAERVLELEATIKAGTPKAEKPKPIFDGGTKKRARQLVVKVGREITRFREAIPAIDSLALQVSELAAVIETSGVVGVAPKRKLAMLPVPEEVQKMLAGDNAERRILAAIKQFPNSHASKIGSLSNVSAKRSTFRLAVSRLRKALLVEGDKFTMRLTQLGESAAIDIGSVPTGERAVEFWRSKLRTGVTLDIFNALLKAGAKGMTSQEIERETGVDSKISTFRLAMSVLKKNDLVTGSHSHFAIRKELL